MAASPASTLPPALAKEHSLPPQMVVLVGSCCAKSSPLAFWGGTFSLGRIFLEVPRLGVELGLLSLAATLVIVTGG